MCDGATSQGQAGEDGLRPRVAIFQDSEDVPMVEHTCVGFTGTVDNGASSFPTDEVSSTTSWPGSRWHV